MAIDSARLQQWLTRFHEAGLKVIQVLPDARLLPVTAGGSTLVAREENYWLRLSPHIACNVEVGLLPLLMQKPERARSAATGTSRRALRLTNSWRQNIRWC